MEKCKCPHPSSPKLSNWFITTCYCPTCLLLLHKPRPCSAAKSTLRSFAPSTPSWMQPSPPLRERALLNETMVLDVLNEMSPQAFREELFTVLNQYHVQILKTASASGRPGTKTFRRSFGSAAVLSAAEVTDANEARAADPPAPPAAAAERTAPPPAAPPAATAAPTKAAPEGRGTKSKT